MSDTCPCDTVTTAPVTADPAEQAAANDVVATLAAPEPSTLEHIRTYLSETAGALHGSVADAFSLIPSVPTWGWALIFAGLVWAVVMLRRRTIVEDHSHMHIHETYKVVMPRQRRSRQFGKKS
jgi:hypothetical protein